MLLCLPSESKKVTQSSCSCKSEFKLNYYLSLMGIIQCRRCELYFKFNALHSGNKFLQCASNEYKRTLESFGCQAETHGSFEGTNRTSALAFGGLGGKSLGSAGRKTGPQTPENERGGAPENFPGRQGALGKGQSQGKVTAGGVPPLPRWFRDLLKRGSWAGWLPSSKSVGYPEAESLASHSWYFTGSTSQWPVVS